MENMSSSSINEVMENKELIVKFAKFTRLISGYGYNGSGYGYNGIYSYYKNMLCAFPFAVTRLACHHKVNYKDCNFEEAKILRTSLFEYEEIANTIDAIMSGEIKPTEDIIKLIAIRLYEYNKIIEATAKEIISESLQVTPFRANVLCERLLMDLGENSDKPWAQTVMHYRQAIKACIEYNHNGISSVEADEYVNMITSDVFSILRRSSRDTFDTLDKAMCPAWETTEINDEKMEEVVNDLIELTDTVVSWYLPKNENIKYKVSEIISNMKAHDLD